MGCRPFLQVLDQSEIPIFQSELRVGLLEINGRRNRPFFHGQYRLDDACQPARCLRVADVCLDRSNEQRLTARSKYVCNGPRLDGISSLSARAMCFKVLRVSWIESCFTIAPAN